MQFNSLEFLIFFPIVLAVNYALPKKVRYLWLLVASYYFYMCWNAKYALLLLFSTAVTYVSAILLERADKSMKKAVVAASFCLNLAVLGFFKYTPFFLQICTDIAAHTGISFQAPAFDVILPVGISFYTFQA
ncbi:MAG: MBOAT family protein, partial [Lachnospiraceae bacterium]|nr:MBOAT family protein [Lachnospiraceae bacterium]